jgi:hypothetical protein
MPDPPSLDSVVGSSDLDAQVKKVSGELVPKMRAAFGEQEKIQKETLGREEKLFADSENKREAVGHTLAEASQPWNSQAEWDKRKTDPLVAFGSLGSVFGILASAFTHAPLQNSLNASAAAMNAIHDNDADSYKNAYDAWQENSKLVIDRAKLEREEYRDALEAMKTNMQLGQVRMQMVATKLGDQKALIMAENGMLPELYEMLGKRDSIMTQFEENHIKLMQDQFKAGVLMDLQRGMSPEDLKDPQKKGEILQKWTELTNPEFAERKRHEISEEEIRKNANTKYEIMQELQDDPAYKAADFVGKNAMINARSAALAGRTGTGVGGNANLTPGRIEAQDLATMRKQWTDEKMPAEDVAHNTARLKKQLDLESKSITGNQQDKLVADLNRVQYAEDDIGKIEDLLSKHNLISGLGGKITRPGEVVANALGTSTSTDRKQFERDITQLQMWLRPLITGSQGRPIAADASKMDTIAAGLRAGDSKYGTIEAYRELMTDLLPKMKKDLTARATGRGLENAQSPSVPASQGEQPAWKRGIPVGPSAAPDKRSENVQQLMKQARVAPDGRSYVPDPSRPGKYLMVVENA